MRGTDTTDARAVQFGCVIRRRRLALGMKQETLAQAVGYRNRSAISQIEAGLMEPSWEMVQRMAQALGLPLAAFDEEPPAEPPR